MPSVDDFNEFDARRQRRIGVALLVLGLLVIAGSAVKIQKEQAYLAQRAHQQVAQAQTPVDQNASQPAESKPGGMRPTTPAPEPARPQAKPGETTGSAPQTTPQVGTPLPPAPAEKVAPPIERK